MGCDELNVGVGCSANGSQILNMGVVVYSVGQRVISSGVECFSKCNAKKFSCDSEFKGNLSEYQIVYVVKGNGALVVENEKYELSEGHVFLIHPFQEYAYVPNLATEWSEYYVRFDGVEVSNWLKNSVLCTGRVFNIGFNEELVILFKRAIEIYGSSPRFSTLHVAGILFHILGLLIILINDSRLSYMNSDEVQMVERAKILINQALCEGVHPEDIASALGMNYTSFRKKFKLVSGYSPAQYINVLKIKKAKHLLLESSLSVKEIAFKLKYNSLERFITSFKKNTGCTPNRFRKSISL